MLTHINTYVIIPNKSTAISVKKRFCAVLFPAKIYRPATHPIILPSVSPDKILRLYCVGGIFLLWGTYLENFMSRPDVISTFLSTPLQNRGRNFVRSKRCPHHMSRAPPLIVCVLTIWKQLPRNGFERSGRGQESSRGHKFSILENSCPFGTASCWGVPAPNPAGTSTANWNLTNPTCASYYTHVIILYINSFSISKLNLIFAVR